MTPEKPRPDGECLQERISAAHTAYTDAVDIVRRSRGLSRSWRDHLAGVLENKRDRVLQILDIKEPQGLLARLTPEQKATVLAYTGPENFGDASSASPTTAALGTQEGEERAPVQGYAAGIPWSMHLRAYDAYCKKWGPQKAMIDLEGRNCRGGFSDRELDDFIPGWREELSEIASQARTIEALRAALGCLNEPLKAIEQENTRAQRQFTNVSNAVLSEATKQARAIIARALKEHHNG